MRLRTGAARQKTKLFSSWMNYVWLHLHSWQRRVKRLWWLCGYWVPKTYFSQRNQVAITLSQLAKDTSIVTQLRIHISCPSTSQLLFWNVFLEILWANSVHIKTFAIICGCFYWASSEYWEVKSINCWDCIVFRHCEGKDSKETTRCIYHAKLNQH